MDYQPLPTCTVETNTDYELELLRIRSNIPSMKQPMSNKHFDGRSNETTKEEEDDRKYFTDYPLISKWTDDDDDDNNNNAKFYCRELIRAQEDYVKTYIRLTQQEMMMMRNDNDNDNDN